MTQPNALFHQSAFSVRKEGRRTLWPVVGKQARRVIEAVRSREELGLFKTTNI